MSLSNALFLVNRGGTRYKVSGSSISSKIRNGDQVLVQRGTSIRRATYGSTSWNNIQNSDLILVWDGSNSRRVSGANFKALFAPPVPTANLYVSQSNPVPYGGYGYLNWNSTNGTSHTASWKSDPGASGQSIFMPGYLTADRTDTHTYTVTNSSGSVTKSTSITYKGYSLGSISFSGIPGTPRAHGESTLSPVYSNSSHLTNLSYKWTLSLPSDATGATNTADHWMRLGTLSDDPILSTVKNPVLHYKNKTHKDNGATALNTGFGQCPSGVTLTLEITNNDNGEKKTYSQNIKVYPSA